MVSIQQEHDAVAILDALGASSYRDKKIQGFLPSRERVLIELNAWIEDVHGTVKIEPDELVTFTFNDTIVIVLRGGHGFRGVAGVGQGVPSHATIRAWNCAANCWSVIVPAAYPLLRTSSF